MKRIVAVIPARGSSKGLPGKNLTTLINGKTLIGNMVCIARKSGIDEVYVSTDCAEIADAAAYEGAYIIHRPEALSTDTASSEVALTHALENIDGNINTLVFLQCTGPLLTVDELRGAIALYDKTRADVVFTAVPFHGFVWNNKGKGCNHKNHRMPRKRRQDIDPQYLETGEAYIIDVPGYIEHKNRFFGYILPFVAHRNTVEIDDAQDLIVANALLQRRTIDELSR